MVYLLKAMRGSTIQFNNTRFWPTAPCNFLCSNVSWWKADGCSGGTWLSKHQSLCLNFIVSPPAKLDLRPAFTICRMASYVRMELPFLSLVVSRRGTLFLEISANCSFCFGRYIFTGFAEGFVNLVSLIFVVGIYAGSFIPILTWAKLSLGVSDNSWNFMQLARTWASYGGGYPRYAHSDLQNLTHLTPSLKLMGTSNFLMAVLAPLDIL